MRQIVTLQVSREMNSGELGRLSKRGVMAIRVGLSEFDNICTVRYYHYYYYYYYYHYNVMLDFSVLSLLRNDFR